VEAGEIIDRKWKVNQQSNEKHHRHVQYEAGWFQLCSSCKCCYFKQWGTMTS